MSYTKVSIPNLEPNEAGVQLDSGQYVAVLLVPVVLDTTGGLAIQGFARVVDAQGNAVTFNGQPLTSSFSHTCGAADVSLYGSANGVATQVGNAVLGETCAFFADPTNSGVHAQVQADASIRTNIASHQIAQTLTTASLI